MKGSAIMRDLSENIFKGKSGIALYKIIYQQYSYADSP